LYPFVEEPVAEGGTPNRLVSNRHRLSGCSTYEYLLQFRCQLMGAQTRAYGGASMTPNRGAYGAPLKWQRVKGK